MNKITVSREKFDKINEIIQEKELEEISFEFLVGSCFPEIYQNIKKEIHVQYTKGYMDGIKEEKARQREE